MWGGRRPQGWRYGGKWREERKVVCRGLLLGGGRAVVERDGRWGVLMCRWECPSTCLDPRPLCQYHPSKDSGGGRAVVEWDGRWRVLVW